MSAEMGVEGSSGRYFAFSSHVSRKRNMRSGGGWCEADAVGRLLMGWIDIGSTRQNLIRLLAHRFILCLR